MRTVRHFLIPTLGALALALVPVGTSSAQSSAGMPSSASSTQGMPPMPMHPPGTGQAMPMQPPCAGQMPMSHRYRGGPAMGRHLMAGTVTATDAGTGIVKVDASGIALTLHFPPPAMKHLKPGDKITVHMAFSQP